MGVTISLIGLVVSTIQLPKLGVKLSVSRFGGMRSREIWTCPRIDIAHWWGVGTRTCWMPSGGHGIYRDISIGVPKEYNLLIFFRFGS